MSTLNEARAFNREQLRESAYNGLMGSCVRLPLGDLIARMLASQLAGEGDMPRYLGLSKKAFGEMMRHHFPGCQIDQFDHYGTLLDVERSDEHAELRELFMAHSEGGETVSGWVADLLVAGCMGGNHLWQDLGLWSRKDLTALIRNAFAPLADKNVHDMKWKKFFYKQLCIQEGVYTCRAPSCQVCEDYQACFGPEE